MTNDTRSVIHYSDYCIQTLKQSNQKSCIWKIVLRHNCEWQRWHWQSNLPAVCLARVSLIIDMLHWKLYNKVQKSVCLNSDSNNVECWHVALCTVSVEQWKSLLSVPLLYHSMGQIIKSVFLSVYVCMYVCMYVCVCVCVCVCVFLWARLRSHFSTDLHEIW